MREDTTLQVPVLLEPLGNGRGTPLIRALPFTSRSRQILPKKLLRN